MFALVLQGPCHYRGLWEEPGAGGGLPRSSIAPPARGTLGTPGWVWGGTQKHVPKQREEMVGDGGAPQRPPSRPHGA